MNGAGPNPLSKIAVPVFSVEARMQSAREALEEPSGVVVVIMTMQLAFDPKDENNS